MAAADKTKQILADGLREMAACMSFRKIRVGELCQRCQVDRRTFYYHFRDIYDLAAWMFDQALAGNLPDAEGRFRHAGLARTMAALWEDRAFYRKALEENSQNALGSYIMERCVSVYQTAILAQKQGEALTEREAFAIHYHSVGSLTMMRRWLLSDRGVDPGEMAARLGLVMPQILRELYHRDDTELKEETKSTGGSIHE